MEGIPQLLWHGIQGEYTIIVMELLGSSLEHLHKQCAKRFTIPTVIRIAEQSVFFKKIIILANPT